jgi:8-oxo-dGTP diphosphatase
MKHINVAVGVVVKNNTVFVCKRSADAHQGGLWEFPGGKVEEGENPQQALHRELYEEIDIQVTQSAPLLTITHDYTDKVVCLHVFKVTEFKGTASGKEGQPNEWREISQLQANDFPAANKAIINTLHSKN